MAIAGASALSFGSGAGTFSIAASQVDYYDSSKTNAPDDDDVIDENLQGL